MGKFLSNNMHILVAVAVIGVGFLLYRLYKKDEAGNSILGSK